MMMIPHPEDIAKMPLTIPEPHINNNSTMNQRTILELAEELRAHLNTDNDAKRLIIEHVLPLLGISKDTLQHAEQIETLKKTLNSTRRELESILNDLDDCE